MRLPLCYIASPIKHTDRKVEKMRLDTAALFAAQLHDLGVPVFCPAAHSRGFIEFAFERQHWDYWQAVDLPILRASTFLIVLRLEGWVESEGVTRETVVATETGKDIFYYAPGQSINELVELLILSSAR